MRKFMTVVGAASIFAFAPTSSEGQILFGPEIAFHDDADFGVGAVVEFDVPSLAQGMGFWGDFLIFFPGSNQDYFEFNTNLTYNFPLENTTVVPFALAGLNIGRSSYDGDDDLGVEGSSRTDLGLNLGGGASFQAGSFRPRVGLRIAIADNTGVVLFASVPFHLAAAN